MKKTIFALVLAIMFSCAQAFAASKVVDTIDSGGEAVPVQIYDKDVKAFGADFNAAAKKLGNFTIDMKWNLLFSDNGVDNYVCQALRNKDIDVGVAQLKATNNLAAIMVATTNEKDAQQAFQTVCYALGLTKDEINVTPVFAEEEVTYNLWSEAAKRTFLVSTYSAQSVYIVGFVAASE